MSPSGYVLSFFIFPAFISCVDALLSFLFHFFLRLVITSRLPQLFSVRLLVSCSEAVIHPSSVVPIFSPLVAERI